jgi:extradiol dioxygenase family protein
VTFLEQPAVLNKGTNEEQAKMYLNDPSYNVIEIKAYRDVVGTLGLHD